MKVAIWGSYNYGNYGDDIMALQFATYLKKLGAEPFVYGLDDSLAKEYALHTTNSWDELFDGAKFCIIGGGGVLVNNLTKNVDEEFRELNSRSISNKCPVYPISIGGQGLGVNATLSPGRTEFFKSEFCHWSTVRLKEDVELLNKLGKEAFYYPDVLLSVPDYWEIPVATKSNDQIQVGVNIPDSSQGRLFAAQLKLIAQVRKDIVFHFIPTYLPDSSVSWELLPKTSYSNFKTHVYTDPKKTMQFLASLDLLISYKLHLGLTALALGVPFYSLGGPGKAHQFLKNINAEFAILPAKAKIFRLAAFLANPNNVRELRNKFDFNTITQLRKESWGHMERLGQLVNSKY
jgi:polysaccharide pyruvyl transferase WcaK-like protein